MYFIVLELQQKLRLIRLRMIVLELQRKFRLLRLRMIANIADYYEYCFTTSIPVVVVVVVVVAAAAGGT